MAARRKSRFKRKVEKRYDMVEFDLDFIEGTFELPKYTQVPGGIQRKLPKGDVDPLYDFIGKYGGQDTVEIMDDFSSEEIDAFMQAWAKASGVELGK